MAGIPKAQGGKAITKPREAAPVESGGDVTSLYTKFAAESKTRAAVVISAEEVRSIANDIFDKTGESRLLLSAVVKTIGTIKGAKVKYGSIRGALKKSHTVEQDTADGKVYVRKK